MTYEVTYWSRFREMDGGWSDWFRCTADEYDRRTGDSFYDTATTLPAAPAQPDGVSK